MKNVVLDTNILHQEGLSSRNMQLLHRLVSASHIKIYVPEFVMREFLTKRSTESQDVLQEALNKFKSFNKIVSKDSALYIKADEAQKAIVSIKAELDKQISADFEKWIKDFSVQILPLKIELMKGVIDDYFLGGNVYKKPKSRDDIPDAIINCSIQELLKEKGSITVVINDGVFKKHLETIPNINVSGSLTDFLALKENKDKFDQLDALSAKTEEIKAYFLTKEFSINLQKYFVESTDVIEDIYLEENDISLNNGLEISSFGERINSPIAKQLDDLVITNVENLNDNSFSITLSFTTMAEMSFCGEYYEYMAFEDDTNMSFDSMNGDGVCDLAVKKKFKFNGFVEVDILHELNINEIKKYSSDLNSSDNPISIELDIKNAEMIKP